MIRYADSNPGCSPGSAYRFFIQTKYRPGVESSSVQLRLSGERNEIEPGANRGGSLNNPTAERRTLPAPRCIGKNPIIPIACNARGYNRVVCIQAGNPTASGNPPAPRCIRWIYTKIVCDSSDRNLTKTKGKSCCRDGDNSDPGLARFDLSNEIWIMAVSRLGSSGGEPSLLIITLNSAGLDSSCVQSRLFEKVHHMTNLKREIISHRAHLLACRSCRRPITSIRIVQPDTGKALSMSLCQGYCNVCSSMLAKLLEMLSIYGLYSIDGDRRE